MTLSAAIRLSIYGPLVDKGLEAGKTPSGSYGVKADVLKTLRTPWGTTIQVHHLIADHTVNTMKHVAAAVPEFVPRRSDSFVPRTIRGSTATSLHAYGLAVDWFTTPYPTPPPGGVWVPYELRTNAAIAWRAEWKRHGWNLGAEFSRTDLPHIEWADTPPVAPPAPIPPIPGADMQIVLGPQQVNGRFAAAALDAPFRRVLLYNNYRCGYDPVWGGALLDGTPTIELNRIPVTSDPIGMAEKDAALVVVCADGATYAFPIG